MSDKPKRITEPVMKDGPTVWWVQSRTRPDEPHVVDLESWKGWGACDCEDFKFHRQKWLNRGATPGPQYQCWHIEQAFIAVGKLTVRQIMDARGTTNQREDGP